MQHSVFSIVTPIRPGCLNELTRVLDAIKPDPSDNPYLPFSKFPEVHFSSFVVFDDSLLVFENNVDGSRKKYLRHLAEEAPGIDAIYQNCEEYPIGQSAEKRLGYLQKHARKPELYHIGTPFRSARSINDDRALRQKLDTELDALTNRLLPSHLDERIAESREHWVWERLKQRIAWAAGGLVSGLVIERLWPCCPIRARLLAAVFASFVGLCALVDLRDVHRQRLRKSQWIAWILIGFIAGVAIQYLSSAHRWPALIPVALLPLSLWMTALLDVRHNFVERLREAAQSPEEVTPAAVCDRLRAFVSPRTEGALSVWARIWSFKAWLVAWLAVWAVMYSLENHPLILPLVIMVAFTLKATWLSALVGWPDGTSVWPLRVWGKIFFVAVAGLFFVWLFPGYSWWAGLIKAVLLSLALGYAAEGRVHWRIWLFVGAASVGGFLLVSFLFWWGWWLAFIAAAVLGALFALWAVPLPSPDVQPDVISPERRRKLLEQEDRDVQNHMAAVVRVRRDVSRVPLLNRINLRVWLLKSFLITLNHVFFRAWLPNIYRGKLFGIPTVHFCQWILLNEEQYLFLSNYDHSWTRYLDDFGTQLTTGVQKIWGQGRGNPGTKNLDRFKDFARSTMEPYGVWYSAYPGLTLRQIWNNEQIRRDLLRSTDDTRAVATLRRFGTAPRTLNAFSK